MSHLLEKVKPFVLPLVGLAIVFLLTIWICQQEASEAIAFHHKYIKQCLDSGLAEPQCEFRFTEMKYLSSFQNQS